MIALLDDSGQIRDFVTSGLTPQEHRRFVELLDGMRFFEYLLPDSGASVLRRHRRPGNPSAGRRGRWPGCRRWYTFSPPRSSEVPRYAGNGLESGHSKLSRRPAPMTTSPDTLIYQHQGGTQVHHLGEQFLDPGLVVSTTHLCPVGRTATSTCAFETSMPTNLVSSSICTSCMSVARPCTMRVPLAQATVRALLVVGAATLAPLRSYMIWVMSVCRTRIPLAEVIVTHQNQDTR